MTRIAIYDTTLRDGSQGEGVNFSLQDKLLITKRLDELGVDYVEGGYPLSNPKDAEYFRAVRDLELKHAKIAAFGMTRRRDIAAESDVGLKALVAAKTPAITVVGKSWDLHAKEVLGVSLEENARMIADSVAFLAANCKELIYDAEHFFDGFKHNPDYALKTLKNAEESGARWIVLCDTNGGALPEEIAGAVEHVRREIRTSIGIHTHNDGDLAVANTLAAVRKGATQVQGTINGIGERCGNVDLCSVVANLALKMSGFEVLQIGSLARLTEVSRYVYETANMNFRSGQPFVGASAFAHKGGMHVHGVRKIASSYEHIDPEKVGNERRVLVSELSGKSNVAEKLGEYGLEGNSDLMAKVLDRVQDLENQGYQFEAAEATFVLLVEKIAGRYSPRFERLSYRVSVENGPDGQPLTEATVKIRVGDQNEHQVSEGDGPVNALDGALRKALESHFPRLREMQLVDYKVRVINEVAGTAARVRVVIESKDADSVWGTVGVSENIIEASWLALVDAFEHKLAKDERGSRDGDKAGRDDMTTVADDATKTAPLAPTQPEERLQVLDMLRGFALLGICVINLEGFYMPYHFYRAGEDLYPAARDVVAMFLIEFLGSGKFNSLFSFLFGVGFAIQLQRASTKGANFVTLYLRRLIILFAFGVAHCLLIWSGDVLHMYALIGLPLIFVRKWSDRWLWTLAALLLVGPISKEVFDFARQKPNPHDKIYWRERSEEQLRIFGKGSYDDFVAQYPKTALPEHKPVIGRGSYTDAVKERFRETYEDYTEGDGIWFWPILGTTMIMGFIVGRRRIFHDLESYVPLIRKLCVWSGVVGLFFAAVLATSSILQEQGSRTPTLLGTVAGVFYVLNRPVLSAFYVCVLVLLSRKPALQTVAKPLAIVGRMPLTNYLMQSVIASFLFYGYGLGYYARIGPATGVLVAFGIYAFQVLYSTLWMSRFRFGPMEWLWRTLTYGHAPRMSEGPVPGAVS